MGEREGEGGGRSLVTIAITGHPKTGGAAEG